MLRLVPRAPSTTSHWCPSKNYKRMEAVRGAFFSPAALASTWYVNGVSGSNSNNCTSPTTPCKTIGRAISLAASGDTVTVAAATYTENLTINIIVKVIGSGANTTIIDGGGVGTVVKISNTTAHVTLSKLTIRNGNATSGAGVNNSGTLTLTNSTVSGNLVPIPCIRSFVFCELRETLNKPVSSRSKCSARPVQALGFGFFRSSACLGGSPVISNLRSRAKPVPRATVFSAPSTDSPARTPRTVGWHSSSVLDSVASQIRTSASSPQTHALPSTAPSTCSGSSPAPLRQHHPCSGNADGCSPGPVARMPGSLRSVRDRPDRPTLGFLRRAIDRAAPSSRQRWPTSPPPCG